MGHYSFQSTLLLAHLFSIVHVCCERTQFQWKYFVQHFTERNILMFPVHAFAPSFATTWSNFLNIPCFSMTECFSSEAFDGLILGVLIICIVFLIFYRFSQI